MGGWGRVQPNFTAPCIPAPVSCLDRAQICHLRSRGRRRSLPFSGFCPELGSSAGNVGLGQLSSRQAVWWKELLRDSPERKWEAQPSSSALSGGDETPLAKAECPSFSGAQA